jgi:hypothetical protein
LTPFSLARLHYDREAGIVTYDPRPCSRSHPSPTPAERFSPLDALAALTAHIPAKGQQVVRYCGTYSNQARGQRRLRQSSAAGITPVAVSAPEAEPDDFGRHCKRAWARLIRKVWAADPLACPKCGGRLRIVRFIEDRAIIEKILRHLKLWNPPTRPPPPRASTTLETDADFLAWEAAGRLLDGIDGSLHHVAPRVISGQNQAVMRKVCPADDGKRVRGSVPRALGTLPLTLCADLLLAPRQ